jgi:hypothetical protein
MTTQDGKAVTIVTQTRVEPGKDEEFAKWQQRVSEAVAAQAGFVKETVMPPSPPSQIDWVILQRFASRGPSPGCARPSASVSWRRRSPFSSARTTFTSSAIPNLASCPRRSQP